MKRLILSFVAMSSLAVSSVAFATYTCTGPATTVRLNPGGTLAFSSAGTLTSVYICKIGETYNGVGSEQCKAILALLLSAQAQQKNVIWSFSDGLTCTTHPMSSNLTGWFSGPDLTQ